MNFNYTKLTDKAVTNSVSGSDKVIVNIDGKIKQATVDQVVSASTDVTDLKQSMSKTNTEMTALKKSVSDGKKLVADAITGKGVTTAADASYSTMASNINSIKLGSGTAKQADVLSGKTYSSDEGTGLTGTMANKKGTTVTASTVTSDDSNYYINIPATGAYNTSSKLSVDKSKFVQTPTLLKKTGNSKISYTMPKDGYVIGQCFPRSSNSNLVSLYLKVGKVSHSASGMSANLSTDRISTEPIEAKSGDVITLEVSIYVNTLELYIIT